MEEARLGEIETTKIVKEIERNGLNISTAEPQSSHR